MAKISKPIIHKIDYTEKGLKEFAESAVNFKAKERKYLLDYPTVYIINNESKKHTYNIYIGETADIKARTKQHLNTNKINEEILNHPNNPSASMYMIGHEYFNKSLTLDIENKLMHYLSTVEQVDKIYNSRTNEQNKYYTVEYFEGIFSKVWEELRKKNENLFPLKRIIEDSALFKASPFHKLTPEQNEAKNKIYTKVIESLKKDQTGELILVAGEAGSGKTVLMSSLFYEIKKDLVEELENKKELKVHMIVNHDAQLKVYNQIAEKLDLTSDEGLQTVLKPTRLINNVTSDDPLDVVIVDEAHLLWTQGKQAYRGKNQLHDLLERAKVVIAVFDVNQILTTEQYWEEEELEKIKAMSKRNDNYIFLTNQMRIDAEEQSVEWIRNLVDNQTVLNIPSDNKGYEIKIFEDAGMMHKAIKDKSMDQEKGISRVVATFDWEYVDKRKPENDEYWMVRDKDFEIPWNYQLKPENRSVKYKDVSWAEQPHTINEAGSTYTVQGFDLNYVGVIIGPSVKYRNGKIIFDREASENKKAKQRRSLKDGSKEYLADFLLKNELNVLLTRGIHGLYLYAVDDALQEALLKAQKGEIRIG
ncbi:DUF2075 domain-containing protein [Phocicoccus pinnipedialis]|uniref:GIY-YIG domain-containing protein n=1 Tax=Phocicoccus pinnipedialis TaxID=110845 RepID=A0A6V7RE11_9BACL|nr:DUF2075 domain-containing protein [Jeotgalicoccus pinnipedialis]MBP1939485.1 DUF2075 family protein/Cdc6-like AAA superfamily ATPase/predicted GIY-YIG superfamily endonuclease [Jeotgalicoccus pinnipedialis]CAD2075196.1 hypothetical protein JEOPIN946_00954 [Jeotgalicoccus pinnipedialis]